MNTIKDLKHVTVPLTNKTGEVIVLNTGAMITSESEAMLQALHSRSNKGLKAHLEILAKKGSENFMSSFYVGYGHQSIGDCGSTTMFIEGVSMLAAKAIQDWALYSGQEVSTRYVDFSKVPFIAPGRATQRQPIMEDLRRFYLNAMSPTVVHLRKRYPKCAEESRVEYSKAINARAFDILRGFLPAGATTNLAWHTNLRQAADKIALLRHHTLPEVRDIAYALHEALRKAHPNSFIHKTYSATERYRAMCMNTDYFHDVHIQPFCMVKNTIDPESLERSVLEMRPPKTELPKRIAEAGTVQFEFLLDFASFRDIQRHRAVEQRMPLLTTDIGFGEWYLENLPEEVREEAKRLLIRTTMKIRALNLTPEESQYFIPMGYLTSNRLTGNLSALVYLVELRATRFVHPTLRRIAIRMADVLESQFGKCGLVLHLDAEPDRFDIARGKHDITLK